MTLLQEFKAADKLVNELASKGGIYEGEGYEGVKWTKEYEEAHQKAEILYNKVLDAGLNPWG